MQHGHSESRQGKRAPKARIAPARPCDPQTLIRVRMRGSFLRNHAPDIAAMDLFVVLTIVFDLLYAFVIVRLEPQRPHLDQRHSPRPNGLHVK